MVADALAEEADFFSLGSNDLTQYALTIDQQNPKLDNFYDPHHPAVLRMSLDELSVSPSAVLPLRKLFRGMDLRKPAEKVSCISDVHLCSAVISNVI